MCDREMTREERRAYRDAQVAKLLAPKPKPKRKSKAKPKPKTKSKSE